MNKKKKKKKKGNKRRKKLVRLVCACKCGWRREKARRSTEEEALYTCVRPRR